MTDAPAARPRPFYTEYAWAFDLIIDRPVRKECAVIASWLIERGVLPGARLLDAGCGTGRYARELARRGYRVHGIDRSPDLLDVAATQSGDRTGAVSFALGDILTLPVGEHDAILCRGVLNAAERQIEQVSGSADGGVTTAPLKLRAEEAAAVATVAGEEDAESDADGGREVP